MKKFMLTVLIIVTSFSFAQEVTRLNDSTFVYPCVTTDSTDYNLVGLPLLTDWTMASDFDPAGTNIEAVSRWDSLYQSFKTTVYSPYFGWVKDFTVHTGNAYFINAKNNFDFTVIGDSVNVVYNLLSNLTSTDWNYIVHPLTKANLTTAGLIGNDINYTHSVSKYLNTNQRFFVSVETSVWLNNFMTMPGLPLVINMNENRTWPSLKSGNDINATSVKDKNTKGGNSCPRIVFIHLVDDSGNELTEEEMKLIQFDANIVSRPGEVLTENSYDCGFMKIGGLSVAYVNLGSFPTAWLTNIGDLYFKLTNFDPMEGYELQFTLNKLSETIYKGFEPLIMGSGLPCYIDMSAVNPLTTPAVTTTILDNTITLDWGFVAEATGYSIYSSVEPYGTFSYVTTTSNLSWSTAATENKKFFYVVSTNAKSSVPPKTIEVKEKK